MRNNDLNSTGKAAAITLLIVAGIFLSLLALLAALNRHDQIVEPNQEIQYDDFAFSVVDAMHQKTIGTANDLATADGEFYIVAIKVANRAKRVDYRFRKNTAILVDRSGRQFHFSARGQDALERGSSARECSGPIPAGSSCISDVVFDLPSDAKLSHLRISPGGPIGDLLDIVFFGTKRIDLRSAGE
jgi:hypothetical protein